MASKKGIIGILTGGGDVPRAEPGDTRRNAARAARRLPVIGIRHGWAGLVETVRDKSYRQLRQFFCI